MNRESNNFERWYRWSGVPAGTTYSEADRMVDEAVRRLEAERDACRKALEQILDFDAFLGSPISPRETPTTEAMRRIARAALFEGTANAPE